MPRWRLSRPLPAAPTSPSRLHRSSSPITVDSPSCRPLMSSCSCAVHCHPLPSITIHRHTVHHRQVAIAPSLSVHHHCNRSPSPSRSRCPSPYTTIKEPSRHPLPSRSRRAFVAPCHPSLSRSRPLLSIRLLLSSRRRSVHCCPSLLSRRRAIHRRRMAPSITIKSPSHRPLPFIAIAITVHQHHARAIPRRPSPPISRRAFHHCQVAIAPSIAVHCCPSLL
jgi:hypothetical protein